LKNYEKIKQQVTILTTKQLSSFNIKKWYRAYYNAGIYHHAKNGTRNIPCGAGSAFFYMHPNGDIFPDMVLNKKFGNLEKQSFDEIWYGYEAEEFRNWISDVHKCPNQCWMVCTVAPWIRNNKFKLIPWIIKNKINAHLNHVKIDEEQFIY
jgi:radical SAM protein with 4Fe4S-binding SPASM domain